MKTNKINLKDNKIISAVLRVVFIRIAKMATLSLLGAML
jgi:hypothetical protein